MIRYRADVLLAMASAAALSILVGTAQGQTTGEAPTIQARRGHVGNVHPQASGDAATGFRFALEGNFGRPLVRGGARRIWDTVGGLGLAPGSALGVGYDARRFGISVAIDMAAVRLDDPVGAGVGLLALLHWRPAWHLPAGWKPRLSLGYVRQGVASDFAEGEFPRGVTVPEFAESEIAEGGSAMTIADGVRVSAGAERTLWRAPFSWFVTGSVDFLTFRQVTFHGVAQSLREAGWSAWPRLSIGLQLHL